jgi:hypothetical protein
MSSQSIIKVLRGWQQRRGVRARRMPLRRGPALHLAEAELPEIVQRCPVALRYYRWLGQLNWAAFPERDFERSYPQPPISHATFAAACLVKVDQELRYMTQLRAYLVEHPGLTWLLGFGDVSVPPGWDFEPERVLPTARHLTQLLRRVPNARFQYLLDESVRLVRGELSVVAPAFGSAISLDTKHILAWVRENNRNTRVSDRYDKTRQPRGDADCKLGYKAQQNRPPQLVAESTTPTRNPRPASSSEVGNYYWGYASGVVATKVPGWGEFVLAELTQPFNRHDITYFTPLMTQTEERLGFRPLFGAFDAAFDAFYVYDHFHRPEHDWPSGFAAVPFTGRNKRRLNFNEAGDPYCAAGEAMRLKYTFTSRATNVEHQRDHYVCPLVGLAGAVCPTDHPRWAKGGCTQRLPSSAGARLRHQIDRESDLYHAIYDQRTATERINAQAKELGIERPHLRNQQSITNQNTLIYVVLNLRGLRRIQARKQQLAALT